MSTWTNQLYKLVNRVREGDRFILFNDTWSEDENIWTLSDYNHHVYWVARIRPRHDNNVIRELMAIKDYDTFNHNLMMFNTVLMLNKNLKGR